MALSKSVLVFCVVLRLLAFGALVASIVVLVTNQFSSSDGTKTTFKDVFVYRYVLSTACVGCFFTLIQLPFAIYYAHQGKGLIRNNFLPNFDFYGDKIVSLVLASGVGAGFAVTFELKRFVKSFFKEFGEVFATDDEESKALKFLDRVYIVSGLLLLGCLCVALLSVFSSIAKSNSTKGFFR